MQDATQPTARAPLTREELDEYLLWRYNLGGYDDNIDAWRATKRRPEPHQEQDTTE